jgi:hypothetical protein
MIEEPVYAGEGTSRFTFSNDVERARDGLVIGGVEPPGQRFWARIRTTPSRSASMFSGISGLGIRKSSKSAAEKTSISPAPFSRKVVVALL